MNGGGRTGDENGAAGVAHGASGGYRWYCKHIDGTECFAVPGRIAGKRNARCDRARHADWAAVMTWEPAAFRQRLQQYVDDAVICLGVQATVSHAGVDHDIALGQAGPGQPTTPDSIWRLYCTGKPVVALAVGLAIGDGLVDLDLAYGDHGVRDEFRHVRSTPRQLLDHTAGLHGLRGFGFGALPPDLRAAAVAQLRPPPGWDSTRQAAYSEYAAWHLLGCLVEDVTGRPLADVVRHEVAETFAGGDIWFGMTEEEYQVLYSRLAVPCDLRGPYPLPLLAHRNRHPCTETNAAYGGYATARALHQFYRAILDMCSRRHPDRSQGAALASLVRASRPARYDEVFHRRCTFGLGFMVELAGHGFDPCVSNQAFGHTGFFGTSFAMADPTHDVVVAVIWNGVVDGDLGVHVRRNAVLRALYHDIQCPSGIAVGDPISCPPTDCDTE